MSTTCRPSTSTSVSTGRGWCPGRSCTTTRSSPRIAFRIELLPTFGRPMMQIAGARPRPPRPAPGRLGQPLDEGVQQVADAAAVLGRHRVDVAHPHGWRFWATASGFQSSHLLATSMSGRPDAAQALGDLQVAGRRARSARRPRRATRSASSIPRTACAAICRPTSLGSASSMPPVSMSWKARPFHSVPAWRRSRVTPGCGVDHGVAPSGEAVEERRLAHVRVAHDRDRGLVGVEGAPGGHPPRPRAGAGLGVPGVRVDLSHRRAPADPGGARPPAAAAPPRPPSSGRRRPGTAGCATRARGRRGRSGCRTPPAPGRSSAGVPQMAAGTTVSPGTSPSDPAPGSPGRSRPSGWRRPLGEHQQQVAAVQHLPGQADGPPVGAAPVHREGPEPEDGAAEQGHREELLLGHVVGLPRERRDAERGRVEPRRRGCSPRAPGPRRGCSRGR